MATPNANDGTALGTGEVISNEAIGVSDPRADPNLPVTAYKIPRSKIAVGQYDQDWGDATFDRPLPAESRALRQAAEITQLLAGEQAQRALVRYSGEANIRNTNDLRGQLLATRGMR